MPEGAPGTPADQPLTGQAAVDQLVAMLDLDQVEPFAFRGLTQPDGRPRVYGGHVAAQALVAAGRTVDPGRLVHSLHGYFVRAGDPSQPIDYHVERIRDGRSFSVRRSVASQGGETIFFMSASFQSPQQGLEHQLSAPEVPDPEQLPDLTELLARYPRSPFSTVAPRPLDMRPISDGGWMRPGDRQAQLHHRAWMRFDGRLPDDPLVHACALTYASDMTLLDAVMSYHGEVWGPGGLTSASLDHALWFHRDFRADEWFLYDMFSPSSAGARGLATGRMFTVGGSHIATAVQEGLFRRLGD